MPDAAWRRIAGFRVVLSWPQAGYAPPPTAARSLRARLAGIAGVLLIAAGTAAVGVAVGAQVHAPQPSPSAAGVTGPAGRGPWLARSLPVSVQIPAIGVNSRLLHLGLNADGTVQVPSLRTSAGEAAWYEYSATPGQIGSSVIEGHVDSLHGPAVFFRLGALRPGDTVEVTLADGITAIFRVTGVREYAKSRFPARAIYGAADFAALRLITCGGAFDNVTGHYLSSTVVFASLAFSRPARGQLEQGQLAASASRNCRVAVIASCRHRASVCSNPVACSTGVLSHATAADCPAAVASKSERTGPWLVRCSPTVRIRPPPPRPAPAR